MFNPALQKGEIITNSQLMNIFHCACEGGIRYSSKTGTIVLVINNTKIGRVNVVSGNYVQFAGRPLKNSEKMEGANRRLQDFLEANQPVFLFEVNEPGKYRYLGEARKRLEPFIASQDGIKYPVFQLSIH